MEQHQQPPGSDQPGDAAAARSPPPTTAAAAAAAAAAASTPALRARQFAAVLHKNVILQVRGGRRGGAFCGLGGVPALLLQVALPALFFCLMWLPKYYITPYQHPVFLQAAEYDIDTPRWAGASPYEGPALAAGGFARIAFVPDTPEVASLVQRLAMAVSCPSEPYKRICSAASITSFACLFGVQGASSACHNVTACMTTPACYAAAVSNHTLLLPDEAAVQRHLAEAPHSLDAVVVFPQALAVAAADRAAPTVSTLPRSTPWGPCSTHASAASPTSTTTAATASPGRRLLGCGAPGPPAGDGLLLEYVIRLNGSDVPPTQLLQDLFDVSPGVMPLPGNLLWEYRRYWFFVNLQLAIDRSLLGGQQAPGSYPAPLSVRVKPFPWPGRQEDLGAASAAAFFNLLLVYAFMAPTRAVVGSIVREKELRLREGMRILGLSEVAYWWSWSVTHWLSLAASGLLCGLVGLYPFRHSSLGLMLAFYWLFSAALIAFSYFLSTLFSASRVAGTATQFIYALSMIPGFLLPFVRPYGGLSWYLAALSPTSAASLFAAALVNWERLAAGVTRSTLLLPVAPGSSFCVGSVMWLLAVDVLLYSTLTWYCDKVIPQPHGQSLPPYFPLLPSYWRRPARGRACSEAAAAATEQQQQQPLLGPGGSSIGGAGGAYVQVQGLRKVFRSADGSTRVAVEGLRLDMAAGRITALLGQNGAGKTTTISMLVGMLQPSAGTALIGGLDIRSAMPAIRQSLGICPQFDILWPDVTVREHLALFAVIKGAARGEAAAAHAVRAAAEVGLRDKLDCRAEELSGGQRRKLSVAIAFLGDPAVVFLDEPTSGMDPYSRRATWDVIRRRRASSVIVLTTHSMEEADLLADEIHILAGGRLAASGTSLGLKAQYGVGYTLTAVLSQQQQRQQPHPAASRLLQHSGSSSSLASSEAALPDVSPAAQALLQLLQQHVPAAQLVSAAGAEVSVRLPREAVAAFPAALRALDASAAEVGVSSYGLSVTTLEEVFLAIADAAVSLRPPQQQQAVRGSLPHTSSKGLGLHSRSGSKASASHLPGVAAAAAPQSPLAPAADGDEEEPPADMLNGAALYRQQFHALFVKRMLCARRDRLAVITQLLVPLLLVLLAMSVSSLETRRPQQPPLVLSRTTCLMGAPTLLAAAPNVRQQKEAQGFQDSYPRADVTDTGYTHLYHGSAGPPLNLTLEGQLLHQAASGHPTYDALFLETMPPIEALLSSLAGPGPSLTLLVNQSAISGLPAALNQVSSALLRLMVAAGGAPGSPAVSGHSSSSSSSSSSTLPADAAVAWRNSSCDGAAGRRACARRLLAARARQRLSLRAAAITSASVSSSSAAAPGPPPGLQHMPSAGGGHLPSCLPAITAVSSPLPLVAGEQAQRIRQDAGALMLVLCMTLAASVLSASFVVHLVRETENNSKHLQMVSGAPPSAFWGANFAWDMLSFCLPAAGIVALVAAYQQPQLQGARLAALAVLLPAFGAAGITTTYMAHFLFKDEMRALQRLNTAYFLAGYLGFLATWVAGLIGRVTGKAGVARASDAGKAALRALSPHYCFAQGLYDITSTAPGSGVLPIPGLPKGPTNPFAYAVLGTAVLHLALQAVVFGAITVLVDVGVMQLLRRAAARVRGSAGNSSKQHGSGRLTPPPVHGTPSAAAVGGSSPGGYPPLPSPLPAAADAAPAVPPGAPAAALAAAAAAAAGPVSGLVADADVAAERRAVKAGEGLDAAMVVLQGISKAYFQGPGLPPVRALAGLWLRVAPGECFSLLGVNGAGKTTTFRILTGEVTPDTGDALVARHSVLTQLAAARQRLGYCPQHEALPAAMTGREVLRLYGRLRGVAGRGPLEAQVDALLAQLGLSPLADVACGAYSGGNKRKLSVAVALVGGPPLVLLDEPSTGMDPSARRFLWRVLQSQVLRAGRTIILTSHSMEEVEALATRLVILAAGTARCCGAPQHLKSKFGGGAYTLELRLQARPDPAPASAAVGAAASNTRGSQQPGVVMQQQAAADHGGAVSALSAATSAAEHYFESVLPGAGVLEREPGRLLLRLPIATHAAAAAAAAAAGGAPAHQSAAAGVSSLADVFECVEAARGQLGVTDYSLAQSSLERVFLSLAKAAEQRDQQH